MFSHLEIILHKKVHKLLIWMDLRYSNLLLFLLRNLYRTDFSCRKSRFLKRFKISKKYSSYVWATAAKAILEFHSIMWRKGQRSWSVTRLSNSIAALGYRRSVSSVTTIFFALTSSCVCGQWLINGNTLQNAKSIFSSRCNRQYRPDDSIISDLHGVVRLVIPSHGMPLRVNWENWTSESPAITV